MDAPKTDTTIGRTSLEAEDSHMPQMSALTARISQGSMSTDVESSVSENKHQDTAVSDDDDEREDEKEINNIAAVAGGINPERNDEVVESMNRLVSEASHGETTLTNCVVQKGNAKIKRVKKRNKRLKKTAEERTAFDGRKVVYVTECTQTDWDWKDNAEKSGSEAIVPASVARTVSSQKITSASSRSASHKSAQEKTGSRLSMGHAEDEIENKREPAIVTDLTPFFLVPDDEFGIPIVDVSLDSDTSDEEAYEKPKDYRHHLPSIGPPQILRYIRESEIQEQTYKISNGNLDSVEREGSLDPPVLEVPDKSLGMFSGPCEFCGTDIKPFPSLDQQLSEPPESLYCCEEYREFVEFATTTAVRLEEDVRKTQEQISIKVHAHHSSDHDRQLAKERAIQRMHERELQRRQQEVNGLQAVLQQTGQVSTKSGGSSDFQSDDTNMFHDPDLPEDVEALNTDSVISKVTDGILEGNRPGVEEPSSYHMQKRKTAGRTKEEESNSHNMQRRNMTGRNEEEEPTDRHMLKRTTAGRNEAEAVTEEAIVDSKKETRRSGWKARGRDSVGHHNDGTQGKNARGGDYKRAKGRGVLAGVGTGSSRTYHFSLGVPAGGRSSSSFFGSFNIEVARQMKTINYQLSSQRCLEEGWTLRAPSPMVTDDAESDLFIPEPLHPAMIATGQLHGRPMIEKFYQDGSKFLTIFPDGTGNILYPSGQVAILISSCTLGQNTFIVQDDSEEPSLLGVFEPNGHGCCCFANNKVRLTYDPQGGLELDHTGTRKRAWSWKDQETHVHAPPFQPIVFSMNNYLAIRFMAQESIALTFTGKKRSCRFNVGVKLKMLAPYNLQSKVIQENDLLISEHKSRVETILNKVSNLLKFPKSPKVDRILPPLSVSNRRHKVEKLKQEASLSNHKNQKAFKQIRLPPLDSTFVSVS